MYDRSSIKKALSRGKIKDDQMHISKAKINAMVYWGLSKWSRLLWVGGKLNFSMNKKTELVLLTFVSFPLPSPALASLIIESPNRHIYLLLSVLVFLVLLSPSFFYPFDILRQLDTSSFHTGTFKHSWEDP